MKNNNAVSIRVNLFALLIIILVFAGCQFGTEPERDDPVSSMDAFIEHFAPSYRSFAAAAEAERLAPAGTSSAGISATATLTPPTDDAPWTFPGDEQTTNAPTQVNYPSPGLTTTGTISYVSATEFKVEAVTRPQPGFERIYQGAVTTEVYFVDADGILIGDPGKLGTNSVYRDKFQTEYTFANGSTATAYEHILATYNGGTVVKSPLGASELDGLHPIHSGFAPFDINGDMSFEVDFGAAPTQVRAGTNALYSSMVLFKYAVNPQVVVPFMPGSQNGAVVYGTRYYTEHASGSQTVGTTYIVEEAFLQDQFVSPIARMVTRQEVVFNDNGQAVSRRQRMRITINPGTLAYVVAAEHNGLRNAAPRGQDAIIRNLTRDAWPADLFEDFEVSTRDWPN